MTIYRLGDRIPVIGPGCFIAPGAALIGQVRLGRGSSVWFQSVLRADNDAITIGEESNIQDGCVLHVDPGRPLFVGDGVTIGHGVRLHGCSIGHGTLVGIGSVVLNGARIGERCLIGAHSLVTSDQEIPPQSLVVGSPARVVRPLSTQQLDSLCRSASKYVVQAERYRTELQPHGRDGAT